MQAKTWNNENNIENYIKSKYHEFSFLDLIKYLRLISDKDKSFDDFFKKVNVAPHLSLSFQSSDIEDFYINFDKTYSIKTNFLSLYGTSSPLPTFYTEDLIEEKNEDSQITKDFYNIFNKGKYQQYFNASMKYKLSNRIVENYETEILDLLFSFIGQNYNNKFNKLKYFSKNELLRYSNIFLHSSKTKEGLKLLISGLLNIKIDIQEYVKTYKYIRKTQLAKVGIQNYEVGEDIHIGSKISDITTTFKIILYDLDIQSYTYYQKRNDGYKALQEIVNLYIDKSYNWIVEYRLKEEFKYTKLGEIGWDILGENSWITNKIKE